MKYDPDLDDLDPFASDRAEIKRDYRSATQLSRSTVGREDLPHVCGNCHRRHNGNVPARCSACLRWKERHGVERPETRWAQDYDVPKEGQ